MIGTDILALPRADGTLEPYTPGGHSPYPTSASPSGVRRGARGLRLDYRHHLWGLGFSIAEAMDTAQRGMDLDWTTTQELMGRALAEARSLGALDRIACGAGTDQLEPGPGVTLEHVVSAYSEQCEFVESRGGRIILMASRALAACAGGPGDYLKVHDRVLSQVRQPVILHWLGDMFDPALAGYWGALDLDQATDVCLRLIQMHAPNIEGIKVSLLDAQREVALRHQLPAGVRMYTGDDFNYPELIAGDEQGCSHALLGIFDAIAPACCATPIWRSRACSRCSRWPGSAEPMAAARLHAPEPEPGHDPALEPARSGRWMYARGHPVDWPVRPRWRSISP